MKIRSIEIALILFAVILVGSSVVSVVNAAIVVTVTTDKPSYGRGALVGISGIVTSGGSPAPGRMVGIEIRSPSDVLMAVLPADTGSDGVYSAFFQLSATARYGTYRIYVAVSGSDAKGDASFEVSASPPPDTKPPVISNVAASAIMQTSVTIQWTTDEPASSQVEYGTSTSYGSTSPLDQTLVVDHSVTLSGLAPSTTYHFKVRSSDGAGNSAQSGDYIFTTVAQTSSTFTSTSTSTSTSTTTSASTSTSSSTSVSTLSSSTSTETARTSTVSTVTVSNSVSTVLTTTITATIEGLQIQLASNSSVSGLVFDSSRRLLNFSISGPAGSSGFLDATIAKSLLSGQPLVFIDDVLQPVSANEDSNFWHIHVTYLHSQHRVTIGGSNTIPEFPSAAVLLVVFMLVMVAIRRRHLSPESMHLP